MLCGLWLSAEIKLALRAKQSFPEIKSKENFSEWMLRSVFALAFVFAFIFKGLLWFPIPAEYIIKQWTGITLFGIGLLLRYIAIRNLDVFFSTSLQIYQGHPIIESGPYKYIRHPSYCGILIAFLGIGIAMGDYLALASLMACAFFGLSLRMAIEERFMLQQIGDSYANYQKRTRKLLPWLY